MLKMYGDKINYNQKVKWKKAISFSFIIFFMNRMINWEFFALYPMLNEVYVLISEILTIYFALKFVYFYYRKKSMYLSEVAVVVLVALYYGVLLVNTMIQDGNIRRVLMSAYPIVGTLCFIDCESRSNAKELLAGFACFSYFVVFINFFDMVFIKQVWISSENSFLIGGRNQLAIILAFTVTTIAAYRKTLTPQFKNRTKIPNMLFWCIVILTAAISGSTTTLISMAIFFSLFFLKYIKLKQVFINPLFIALGYTVGWIAIIVYRLQYLIADFIMKILHKDITFSHRTIIWDEALRLINENKIWGYGMSDSVNVFSVNHDYTGANNNVMTTLSGHNQILQLLYYGGFVLLVIFIITYFVCCSSKKRKSPTFFLFFIAVMINAIVWLSETPGEYAMFLMLGLCYYSKRFDYLINPM